MTIQQQQAEILREMAKSKRLVTLTHEGTPQWHEAEAAALDAGAAALSRQIEDRKPEVSQPSAALSRQREQDVAQAREALRELIDERFSPDRESPHAIREDWALVDAKVDALIAAVQQAALVPQGWREITAPDRGLFLVTNNINARNAHGHMSHVWITTAIHVGTEPLDGPWYCLQDGYPQRVSGLTHFQPIAPPLSPDPPQEK